MKQYSGSQEQPKQTDQERLNRLPSSPGYCDVCGEEEDDLPSPLQRCSMCKNAFYCSRRCQTKAWKEKHKFECSTLPIGQLAYPEKMDPEKYKELDDEVRGVSIILQDWMDGAGESHLQDDHWTPTRDWPPNKALRGLKLSAPYSEEGYTRSLPDPFRTELVRIIRLFFIHLLASPAAPRFQPNDDHLFNVKAIEVTIDGSSIPSSMTQLWAPKIVCRSGDLSPPEYTGLPMYMWNITQGMDQGDFKNREEKAYAARLLNLMVIYRKLFMKPMF